MNKTPLLHAIGAALYIVGIVFVVDTLIQSPEQETLLVPVAMLSLFVLSALVVGYLFVWEPVRLYLDNKKPQALDFFLKTLGFFAAFAVLAVIALAYASNI